MEESEAEQEAKYRLLLNAWKNSRIKDNETELEKKIQMRFAHS